MWLTVFFDEKSPKWPPSIEDYKVELVLSTTLQEMDRLSTFRTSPIFPLVNDFHIPDLKECTIYFYCYDPAFTVLGRIKNIGSADLKKRVWYTTGLASVVLITEDPDINKELLELARSDLRSSETWSVKDGHIDNVECALAEAADYDPELLKIIDYRNLPVTIRAIIDEFVANIAMIVPKVAIHIPSEISTFLQLVSEINELVTDIVYLNELNGSPPPTLNEYDQASLSSDASVREMITHQDLDRLIQVNSALSYVCTQALSGAVPILERRSLIRRYSLLGIGSAMLALTRIGRSIEWAFSQFPVEDIISDKMVDRPSLSGLDNFPEYDPSEWNERFSVNRWRGVINPRNPHSKLPFFSGRLGFRETEYTISSAIQVITSGSSLDWSLLTITHEMLHGHVRILLARIFEGDPQNLGKWQEFYDCYNEFMHKKLPDPNQLHSVRAILLTYCVLATKYGSLTKKGPYECKSNNQLKPEELVRVLIRTIPQKDLWRQLELEWRNINEIFVHILDLHYFYGTRLRLYIPLIWRSWAAIPHVRSDLRQYILRSLLAIAVKETAGTPWVRFQACVARFDELLEKHIEDVLDIPLIHEVREYIDDLDRIRGLFDPFHGSLILVDLVNNIFVAGDIRARLIASDLLHFTSTETDFEDELRFELPEGFHGDIIEKPILYLLSKVVYKLQHPQLENKLEEEESALLFLACSSNLKIGG